MILHKVRLFQLSFDWAGNELRIVDDDDSGGGDAWLRVVVYMEKSR